MNKEEAIRKMTIEPIGYESPVQVFSNYVEDLVTQKENYIAMQVSEQMHVQVDREELVKALAYERDQYNEGYRNGFLEGYKKGIEQGKDIVIEELKRGIEARFKRELDVKENEK